MVRPSVNEYPRPSARHRARRRVHGVVRRLVRPIVELAVRAHRLRLRVGCAWVRTLGGALGHRWSSRSEAHDGAPLPGVPGDPPVRPPVDGPQGSCVAPLLRLAGAHGPAAGRPDDRPAGTRRRRSTAARARPARPRRAARGPAAGGRAGLAAAARRRRARGALRLGHPGQRAVRTRHARRSTSTARRPPSGARVRRSAGCRCRHRLCGRCVPGWRCATTWSSTIRARRAGRCSATSGASRSPRATCGGSSTVVHRHRRTRTRSATASPRTCSTTAPTCAPCRSCSATPTSPPRSATPTSAVSACGPPTSTRTRA